MAAELIHSPYRQAQIFSGNANVELAEMVANELDTELSPRILEHFEDGEIKCQLEESVRGNYVFVIQSHQSPILDPANCLMEQALLLEAAKGGSASKVFAVCPYFGYARQDRKSKGREPISAKYVCKMLAATGLDGVIGVDLHTGQIQGFIDAPFDNLTAGPVLRRAVLPELEEGVVVVSPDAGRIKVANGQRRRLPSELRASVAYIDKSRPSDDEAEVAEVIGDVEGKQCLLVDDVAGTVKTLSLAAEALKERGARDIVVIATHKILSGNALERLGDSAIRKLIATNTIALSQEQRECDKLQETSVSKVIARAINEVFRDGSISTIFEDGEHLT